MPSGSGAGGSMGDGRRIFERALRGYPIREEGRTYHGSDQPPDHYSGKYQIGNGALYGEGWRDGMDAWVAANGFTFPTDTNNFRGMHAATPDSQQRETVFSIWLNPIRYGAGKAVIRKGQMLRAIDASALSAWLEAGWAEYRERKQ
jgi:hypothetical protein